MLCYENADGDQGRLCLRSGHWWKEFHLIRKTLKKGDEGGAVIGLQGLLAGCGILRTGVIDDQFGDKTFQAVGDLQDEGVRDDLVKGLVADGEVGDKTFRLLQMRTGIGGYPFLQTLFLNLRCAQL
ncbi:MAG: peptidoglycan-binding protein, partial [Patescibacteria group bacterium]